VPILKAFSTIISGVPNPKLKKQFEEALRKVAAGESFSQSLTGVSELPPFFKKMAAIGEKSGRLDLVLEELSVSYNRQIEMDISLLSAVLEPVMILGIGSILGALVMSILIPMFQITQTVS